MDTENIVEGLTGQVRKVVFQVEERAAEIISDAEREAGQIRAEAREHERRQLVELREGLSELGIGVGFEPDEEVEPNALTTRKAASAAEPDSEAERGRRRFSGIVREVFQRAPEPEPAPQESQDSAVSGSTTRREGVTPQREEQTLPSEEPARRRFEPIPPDEALTPTPRHRDGDQPSTDELIEKLKSWTD